MASLPMFNWFQEIDIKNSFYNLTQGIEKARSESLLFKLKAMDVPM